MDDVPANVDVLVQALRGQYQLSVAIDGTAALRTAERLLPDLVLLDIVMPGLDGYKVCRRLRSSARTREIPVRFLSALEDVQDKAKGFEAGGNDYLVKPFEILEVQARVRSLLRAKAYADAVKEKVAYELQIALEIQMGILPRDVAAVAGQARGWKRMPSWSRPRQWAATSMKSCERPTGTSLWPWGTSPAKGFPPPCLWR